MDADVLGRLKACTAYRACYSTRPPADRAPFGTLVSRPGSNSQMLPVDSNWLNTNAWLTWPCRAASNPSAVADRVGAARRTARRSVRRGRGHRCAYRSPKPVSFEQQIQEPAIWRPAAGTLSDAVRRRHHRYPLALVGEHPRTQRRDPHVPLASAERQPAAVRRYVPRPMDDVWATSKS